MAYIPPNVNGQAAMANSAPVVIASNQTNVPVAINSLIFPASTNNSSVVQLAASAIFVGALENTQNLQAAQLEVFSDQPYTIFIEQFIDAAGTKLSSQDSFTRLANVPYGENVTIPGNYFRIRVQNTGASATTTLQVDTTFGIMATGPRTVTNFGNNRMALNEIGGSTLNIGQQLSAASIPVVVASDQTIKIVNPDVIVLATNITTQNLVPNGAATAGSAVEISLNGDGTLSTQITGTYTGALSLQVTINGTAWVTVGGTPFINVNTSTYLASITSALTSVFQSEVAGFIKARITALAAVTGTATVNLQASSAASMFALDTAIPAGTNTIGNVGIVSIAPTTYVVSIAGLAPATLATDIVTITGSASKTIAITRIDIDGVQTTASQIMLFFIRRSTADTGGTSTSPTAVPLSSLSTAATATVLAYTANPAVGTVVGTVVSNRLFIPGAATTSDAQGLSVAYGALSQQPLYLRGTSQVLAVNLNGVTVTGGLINVNIEWTES